MARPLISTCPGCGWQRPFPKGPPRRAIRSGLVWRWSPPGFTPSAVRDGQCLARISCSERARFWQSRPAKRRGTCFGGRPKLTLYPSSATAEPVHTPMPRPRGFSTAIVGQHTSPLSEPFLFTLGRSRNKVKSVLTLFMPGCRHHDFALLWSVLCRVLPGSTARLFPIPHQPGGSFGQAAGPRWEKTVLSHKVSARTPCFGDQTSGEPAAKCFQFGKRRRWGRLSFFRHISPPPPAPPLFTITNQWGIIA